MDRQTAHMLNELNLQFYKTNAESFSRTRENPWKGWEYISPFAENATTILDVACGNLRFERYVKEQCGFIQPKFYCVDACPELVDDKCGVSFQKLDIVGLCIDGYDLEERIDAPACDLVVSFGFFHHVPGLDARIALFKALVDKTASGGTIVLSFWQFMNDERLAAKAKESTARLRQKLDVNLDEDDYLLGWQDVESACRYCHHFTDGEIYDLVMSLGNTIRIIDRFSSDGKTIPLNSYVVVQKG